MQTEGKQLRRRRGLRWWATRILIGLLILIVGFGLLTWLAGASAKADLLEQHPAPGQLVGMDGYNMHINCTGQGSPTVVMDAGNNEFSLSWARVQPEVAQFTRVCVYDRAGFGWSESGQQPRTSETIVKELHTLLDNAQIEGPYLLVGHSFGGMNVRLFAHNYPDKVAGLVLVDSAHEEQGLRVPALKTATDSLLEQFQTLSSMSSLGLLAMSPENIPNRDLPESVLPQYRAILAATGYFKAASAETKAISDSFAEVRAAQINSLGSVPIIVLSRGISEPLPNMSEAESLQYEQIWQTMQSEFLLLSSNSKQIVAEQSGHYIQLEQPQLVIDAIRELAQTVK